MIAAILGVVEGMTEFIPVSSTGHLIVAGYLLGFTGEKAKAFEIFIQLGAIVAVVWETRGMLSRLALDAGRGGAGRRAVLNLALAFVPAAVAGLFFHGWIERNLYSPRTVGIALITGAVGILLVERYHPRPVVQDVDSIPARSALSIGLAQCLSLFPGMSRSATTIMGGMAFGLDRRAATQFSFLLAIPTMLAASLYSLFKVRHDLDMGDASFFATGFAAAFVSGLVTVRFLLRWVATHDFRPFAWYRLAAGAAIWFLLT
ncbi:MAG: undecaprenyl-diphosphate phosphatase [Acidobacteria bacterium]|nr:undecaprenyl-diphosphate phosphatase [Acidobacteriota bacterium]